MLVGIKDSERYDFLTSQSLSFLNCVNIFKLFSLI